MVLLTTVLAALVMASGAAFAVNKVCPFGTTSSDPCKGTAKSQASPGNDTLNEATSLSASKRQQLAHAAKKLLKTQATPKK